jgi:hypothetical protein
VHVEFVRDGINKKARCMFPPLFVHIFNKILNEIVFSVK